MKTVILTEKPSAAKNFTKVFGGKNEAYKGQPYEIVKSNWFVSLYCSTCFK